MSSLSKFLRSRERLAHESKSILVKRVVVSEDPPLHYDIPFVATRHYRQSRKDGGRGLEGTTHRRWPTLNAAPFRMKRRDIRQSMRDNKLPLKAARVFA